MPWTEDSIRYEPRVHGWNCLSSSTESPASQVTLRTQHVGTVGPPGEDHLCLPRAHSPLHSHHAHEPLLTHHSQSLVTQPSSHLLPMNSAACQT